ncbi:unnamed protein product [Effrenium voratum]|nr:unnamed protein product [Effrenium voratum]
MRGRKESRTFFALGWGRSWRQAHGELYSPCLSLRLTKIRTPGTWNKIFSEVWQHKLMVKELGPFGAERFDGIKDGKTFLRAGYNLDDPDFWGNVDNYVTTAVKRSGYTSAPKKLAMACDQNQVWGSRSRAQSDGIRRVASRLRANLAKHRQVSSESNEPSEGEAQCCRPAGKRILDHDHVILLGDTNSRLHWPGKLGGMPLQQARQKVQEKRFGELLALDQLNLMRRDGMAFHQFEENRICFLPSYKWHAERDAYDMRPGSNQPRIARWPGTMKPLLALLALGGLCVAALEDPQELRPRSLRPVSRDDDLISALAADASVSVAAPAPAPAPAPGPAGVPKEVVMGYHRLFAHDYFEWRKRGLRQSATAGFADFPASPLALGKRLPCNLQRYAGNYLNLLLALAMAGAAHSRPLLFGACAMAKADPSAVALLAPPEMFDVELLTSGSFRSVGGGWLRLLLAALGEFGLAASCFCRSGARGGLLGGGLVLAHALLRTRPWTDMAKDKVKSAKEQVTRLKSQ